MRTDSFLCKHQADRKDSKWALSVSDDMHDVWNAMVKRRKCDLLVWTAGRDGVFKKDTLLQLACRMARETPLHDGGRTWDLLDHASRSLVEISERWANGKVTWEESLHARSVFFNDDNNLKNKNSNPALFAADIPVYLSFVSDAAVRAAVDFASRFSHPIKDMEAAARAAHIKMIADLGNPFK